MNGMMGSQQMLGQEQGQQDPAAMRRQMIAQLLMKDPMQEQTGGPLGALAQGGSQIAQALMARKLMGKATQAPVQATPSMAPTPGVAGPRMGSGLPIY